MNKQVTPRQRAESARRQVMGIALIQKPLKFIASVYGKDSIVYEASKSHADCGKGGYVKLMARVAMKRF